MALFPDLPGLRLLRLASFDTYQSLLPRTPRSEPVVIVAIDEDSLRVHGQWPWPRSWLARLVGRIAEARPAAIGLDILMAEPDRLSPGRLPELVEGLDPGLAQRLAGMPGNDTMLAQALRDRRVVLGLIGLEQADATVSAGVGPAPVRAFGGDPAPFVRRFAGALRSMDEIDAAAAGRGLISVDPEGGVVRRMPLLATIGTTLAPSLVVEMLRVASGAPALAVRVGPSGIEAVGVGDLVVPTERDGQVWVHFSRHQPRRFVSAADVLAGRADPARFEGRLVLVGVTALGLSDYQATPVADRMTGVEIHAQLLEGIFDRALLSRPIFARGLELGATAAAGLLLVFAVPQLRPRTSVGVFLLLAGALVALGFILYMTRGILLDWVTPVLALGVLYTVMLALTLTETESQRRALRRQVEEQRVAAARLAGELEAARQIQMGSLPQPAAAFPGEKRFELYARLEPAHEVGGDLYDFFRLDDDHLFFMIGDVTGKGLPGSLFMAISKALYKSIALRRHGHVAAMMREADAEISRDNTEGLYVTVLAGILDARTGALEYCSAGHEPPFLLPRAGRALQRLQEGGGPPLCSVDGFPYPAAERSLDPGDTLVLITDGITEAAGADGRFYGRPRLEALLAGLGTAASAVEVGEAIRRDVATFTGGAEPSDDMAVLVIRFNGASPLPSGKRAR
ncbi:MAG TPA: CHASE2 domain-containing protein [Candidatus Nitrosotalea sp.]|nr:CHASE2 domain-containing protein [Candidatus Nitrosotalea sp.]